MERMESRFKYNLQAIEEVAKEIINLAKLKILSLYSFHHHQFQHLYSLRYFLERMEN